MTDWDLKVKSIDTFGPVQWSDGWHEIGMLIEYMLGIELVNKTKNDNNHLFVVTLIMENYNHMIEQHNWNSVAYIIYYWKLTLKEKVFTHTQTQATTITEGQKYWPRLKTAVTQYSTVLQLLPSLTFSLALLCPGVGDPPRDWLIWTSEGEFNWLKAGQI